jgi:hypothetical protein
MLSGQTQLLGRLPITEDVAIQPLAMITSDGSMAFW